MNKKLIAGLIFTISGGATYALLQQIKKKRKEAENNVETTEGPQGLFYIFAVETDPIMKEEMKMKNFAKYAMVGLAGYLVGFYEMKYKLVKAIAMETLKSNPKKEEPKQGSFFYIFARDTRPIMKEK